ncbi:Bone morphogenetic protein 6 [Lamellibrachia satsuma]|nr:Bone morphogenetic protein 6 [Lamellibrachia satsuma]
MRLQHIALTMCAIVIALTSVVLGETTRTGGQIARTARRLARQQRQRRLDDTTRQRNVTRRRQIVQLDVVPTTANDTLSVAEKQTTEEVTTPGLTTPRPTLNIDRWRINQRDKYLRLFHIQSEIIYRLNLKRMPNASSSGYSKDDIVRFQQIYNNSALANSRSTEIVPTDYIAKQFQALTPSCTVPRNTDDVWTSSEAYRLYFIVEPSDGDIKKETNVKLANLHIFKMPGEPAVPPATSTMSAAAMARKRSGNRRRLNRRRHNRRAARSSVRRRQMAAVNSNSGRDAMNGRAGRPRDERLEEEQTYFNVSVYQYIRPVKNRRIPRKKLLDSLLVARDYVGWLRLDILEAVRFWFRRPQRNFGIEISIQDERRRTYNTTDVIASVNCSDDDTQTKRFMDPLSLLHSRNGDTLNLDMNYTDPSLEILSYEMPKERESRNKRATSLGWFRKSPTCAKETFYVSFKDMGWQDWIVQPEGFEAAVCSGTCPDGVKFGPNNVNQKEKVSSEEKCSPSRLQSLSILHYDDNGNLTVSVLEDFIVAECGCRP